MNFEGTRVWGIENAIIGMRLPLCKTYSEAVKKTDTWIPRNSGTDCKCDDCDYTKNIEIGEDDMRICKNLIKADSNGGGQPNSKFLRMIHVQVAITAPLYVFKELDTYKVSTVANSTSTMHKLASTPITIDCFEMDDFENFDLESQDVVFPLKATWESLIGDLEFCRQKYNETKDKRYWKELIRMLPESWLQTRMFDCNYATLRNIYKWRKNHKLSEWHKFCDWIETLPYAQEFIIS